MADLPDTVCFKAQRWLTDKLRALAIEERRTLGQMVRVIVERYFEQREKEDSDG